MESAAILFRDKAKSDKYTDPLLNDHCAVESIPVLEHKYLLDAQSIQDVVDSHTSDHGGFASLVFTSGNAVRALVQAVDLWLLLEGEDSHGGKSKREQWQQILDLPIFVVGQETQAVCRSLLFADRAETVGGIWGGECGCASGLLPKIVEFGRHYSKARSDVHKPRLLFFSGDRRRSTIPDGIKESGAAELVEVVAYTTVGRNIQDTRCDLIDSVNRIVARGRTNAPNAAVLIWMVVFSPSGVRVVAPLLEALAQESDPLLIPANTLADVNKSHSISTGSTAASSDVFYGYAAIGEATMMELASRGCADSVVTTQADMPNPLGICNAIRNKMSSVDAQ
ncbi:uroporphyrinogen-III synthase [Coemansia sp. RSA 1813]|nr:uroporphyrinogen-III synthase [Coemansia sp. RSA 1646]KAJ1765401.1 uroporphyrinogen-III synthase [Coemansia sp. RSA 1843]KAJ2093298.1 uroporphyrinogen-III synthase [Coemansia sp. RSA 986]KAJ2213013.1 uroporphyrinogen-III synthase [Coemansia sp. RSA 487]KAJ2573552.1 uroporphyrinogen-III synthase [Coemansia sp. RSA 1813]